MKLLCLCLALTLSLAVSVERPVEAALVNLETGEGYRPEVDEDGNLEEPPDWVANPPSDRQVSQETPLNTGGSAVATEVLADENLCRSPLDAWLDSASTELVADALHDPLVRDELTDELESFIYQMLRIELAGTEIEISRPTVSQLRCDECDMTYVECLLEGHEVAWCKRTTLNCPSLPTSDLSITVPVSNPVNGQLTFDASASYRFLTTQWEERIEREWCLTVSHYDTEGFGALTLFLAGAIEDVLAQGRICRFWPF